MHIYINFICCINDIMQKIKFKENLNIFNLKMHNNIKFNFQITFFF